MATVYCGVDFHARKQTISYLTTEDGEMQQLELEHEMDEVRAFYSQLRSQGQVIVGFESSGYAAWFEELLEELGCEIWIGNAAEIRRRALSRGVTLRGKLQSGRGQARLMALPLPMPLSQQRDELSPMLIKCVVAW